METKGKTVLTYIRNNLDIVVVFISIFFIEILFRGFLGLDGINGPVVIFDIALSLFICGWMLLMGKKTRLFFCIFVFIILGILAFGQVWHYQYFTTFFSFSKASILSEFFAVKGEAAGKFNFSFLTFFIPILLFIGVFFLKGKVKKVKWIYRIIGFVLVSLLSIGLMGFSVSQYPDSEKNSESDHYLYSTLYNKVKAVNNLGFFSYEIKDFDLVFLEHASVDEDAETIRLYIEEHGYQQSSNQYTDVFKGKNLILVLCESLSPGVINEEITPMLYKMTTEGINFTNNYSPVYQTATCDSEFISLTSMIPSISQGPIAYEYYENSFPNALPSLLNNQGYASNSYHAYLGNFYNRFTLHKTYGFERFYDWDAFDYSAILNHQDYLEAFNWIPDKYLADNMVTETVSNNKYPFFDFMISVTGHIPYNRYRFELESDLWQTMQIMGDIDDKYSEEVIVYYAAQKTLDDAMQTLVADLDEQGILEDTVIVLYGDHYPYGMSEDGLKEYYGASFDTVKMYQTPFFIWTPNIQGQQVKRVTSTFDIYPTLCNLFGLDINGELINGVDALDPNSKSTVIFSDYSWLTDDAYYDATTQTITKYSNISDDSIKEKTDQVFEEIDISQRIITSDYYNKNKEDNE